MFMAIVYIQKNNDGNWKASNAKDGNAFVTVSTKEQAIKRVNLQKGTTGIMLKDGKDWTNLVSTNKENKFRNPFNHKAGNQVTKLKKNWQKTGLS